MQVNTNVNLSDFFSGDALNRIQVYVGQLQKIIDEYDLVVLMARKAICFFDALVKNNEINLESKKCIITTNRVFTYSITGMQYDKIAIIDDIVVKGRTLDNTIKEINKYTDNYKIFFLSYQVENNENKESLAKILEDGRLMTAPIEMTNIENLTLSNAITNYIAASKCTLNIDYPLFNVELKENDFNFIKANLSSYSISNSIQEYFNIEVTVQNIIDTSKNKIFEVIDPSSIIIKLRLFFNKNSEDPELNIIPIVLLPELKKSEIDKIFNLICNTAIKKMVFNEVYVYENKFKWVQYILSYKIFESIKDELKYLNNSEIIYNINRQNWIFPIEYKNDILEMLDSELQLPEFIFSEVKYNLFDVSELYVKFQTYIQHLHHKDPNHDKTVITFDKAFDICGDNNNTEISRQILSNIFDIAIDNGYIVPFTKVDKDSVFRAYRLSEQYELTTLHLKLFTYMLVKFCEYTDNSDGVLDKTLVEKLFVLFFRNVIPSISQNKSQNPDNLYSIHFTRFGPVVSTGENLYEVEKYNTQLSEKLSDDRENYFDGIRLRTDSNGEKYEVYLSEKKFELKWHRLTEDFCKTYSSYYNILSNLNMENLGLNSINQSFILKAIGDSIKNRYLALLAELRLFYNNINIESIETIIHSFYTTMTGITSGAWKYICFTENRIERIDKFLVHNEKRLNNYVKILENNITRLQKRIDNGEKIIERLDGNRPVDEIIHNIYMAYENLSEDKKDESYLFKTEVDSELLILEKNLYNRLIAKLKQQLIDNQYKLIKSSKEKQNFENAKRTIEDNSTKNAKIKNEILVREKEVAKILCELLCLWNDIKELFKNEFDKYKTSLNIARIKNFDPDDSNNNYIRILKRMTKYTHVNIVDLDDLKNRIIDICAETEFLISEYDYFYKNDLVKDNKYSRLEKILVVKHKYNEQIACEKLQFIKSTNSKLEKCLGLNEKVAYCALPINDSTIEYCKILLNLPNCKKIILDFSKEFNQCAIDNDGNSVNSRFISITKKLIETSFDSEIILISDYNCVSHYSDSEPKLAHNKNCDGLFITELNTLNRISPKRFLISFSFSGDKRDFIENIALKLSNHYGKEKILYDKFYESEFARVNLAEYLEKLYYEESELVVALLAGEYNRRNWPGLEWTKIRKIADNKPNNVLLLSSNMVASSYGLRIDLNDGYIDIDSHTEDEIVELICDRLKQISIIV